MDRESFLTFFAASDVYQSPGILMQSEVSGKVSVYFRLTPD